MRLRRILFLVALIATTLAASAPAALAHPCGQYPTLIQPILCRL